MGIGENSIGKSNVVWEQYLFSYFLLAEMVALVITKLLIVAAVI